MAARAAAAVALRVLGWLLGCWLLSAELAAASVDDPYAPWMQGRPAESVAALLSQAHAHERWSDWYDCALAAAAAGERGIAVYCALRAHHHSPIHLEPLQALRAWGAPLGTTWCESLGVLAWPGSGWCGVLLLGAGGTVLGLALARRMARVLIQTALLGVLVATPGVVAGVHDAQSPLLAVVDDTSLLDSAGNVITTIASGTVVHQEDCRPWNGRVLVLAGGTRGWLPVSDTQLSTGAR